MQKAPRILFAGGGTGGHVYPAIAIADAVRRLVPAAEVAFAGTREKMEWEAVPRAGYPIHPTTVSGFHRGQPLRNVGFPFKLAKGMVESLQLVGAFGPDVVVGTGGYVSGPVLLAASLCTRAHLYVWDEPLNFIDVISRMQVEDLLLACRPTLLFVEHDARFCQEIATRRIRVARA